MLTFANIFSITVVSILSNLHELVNTQSAPIFYLPRFRENGLTAFNTSLYRIHAPVLRLQQGLHNQESCLTGEANCSTLSKGRLPQFLQSLWGCSILQWAGH